MRLYFPVLYEDYRDMSSHLFHFNLDDEEMRELQEAGNQCCDLLERCVRDAENGSVYRYRVSTTELTFPLQERR